MKNPKHALLLVFSLLMISQGIAQKKKYEYTIQIDASQEAVWNVLKDYSKFKDWDKNIVDVRCPDGVEKRQNCKVITASGEIHEVEIMEVVPQESCTLRYDLPSGTVYLKRELTSGTPVQVTETVWYRGISQKTFERYRGTDYAQSLKTKWEAFKTYMEDGEGTGK